MTSATSTSAQATLRRPPCPQCGRPLAACWCACVRPVANVCRLWILQHPSEAHEAKGTAALLARCLARADLQVGEHFAAPPSTQGLALLYPDTPGHAELARPAPWPAAPIHTLVVLDGTWRKSRKLLYLNPWLQALPRMTLAAPPPSRYAIRRAQAEDQRSTLEACALALAQLDGDAARYQPLWSAMDEFLALHARVRGQGTHQKPAHAR